MTVPNRPATTPPAAKQTRAAKSKPRHQTPGFSHNFAKRAGTRTHAEQNVPASAAAGVAQAKKHTRMVTKYRNALLSNAMIWNVVPPGRRERGILHSCPTGGHSSISARYNRGRHRSACMRMRRKNITSNSNSGSPRIDIGRARRARAPSVNVRVDVALQLIILITPAPAPAPGTMIMHMSSIERYS